MPKKTKKTVGELIFGMHPVIELLAAKRRKLISLYSTKPVPKGWQNIEKILPKYHVPIQYVTREVLHRMAGSTDHQGVVAWVQPFPFRKKPFDSNKQPFLLMLDGIQDPRNLGAMLRSAYCTGVDGVVLTKKGASPLNAVAIKSSAGLAEHLEVYQSPSAQAAAQALVQAGYTLYLATLKGENALQSTFTKPLCLVIGSEATGITKSILSMGAQITLPQRTADISYNASVAAGILLFLIGMRDKSI